MPKVSVIVPNYNHAVFLKRRLDSILCQTKLDFELIILDDFSSDNSKLIIEKYRENTQVRQIIHNESNSGSTFSQWRKGIELAFGDLIWIAESDDYCEPNFLETLVSYFDDPEVVLAYTRSNDIDEENNLLGLSYAHLDWCDHSFVKDGKEEVMQHLMYQCTIPNASGVLFRKSAVHSSFFQHSYKLCGDWYFYINLLQRGRIVYHSEPLNYHRFHKKSVRSTHSKLTQAVHERIAVVKFARRNYEINYLSYLKAVKFQLKLFVFQSRLTTLFSLQTLRYLIRTVRWEFVSYFFFGYYILLRLFYHMKCYLKSNDSGKV